MEMKFDFIHHVYFWLHQPENKEAQAAMLKGLQLLSTVPNIQQFHIGVPADTNREVIETSYHFSWLAVFNNKEAEEIYQHHPIHVMFIDNCKHLWSKVVVYDSVKP